MSDRPGRRAHRVASRSSRSISPPDEGDVALLVARPLGLRAVPVELEVVAVGVGDVDRLVRPVVGELAQRPVDRLQPPDRVGEVGPRRIQDRDVVQPGDAVGLRIAARRLPRVEREVVVIAAGGDEQDVAGRAPAGHVAELGHHVEAEHADVEVAHAIDVGGAQVDVADPGSGRDAHGLQQDRIPGRVAHQQRRRRAPRYGRREPVAQRVELPVDRRAAPSSAAARPRRPAPAARRGRATRSPPRDGGSRRPTGTRRSASPSSRRSRSRRGRTRARRRRRRRAGAGGPRPARSPDEPLRRVDQRVQVLRVQRLRARRRSAAGPATPSAAGRRPARARCRPGRAGRSPRACRGRTSPRSASACARSARSAYASSSRDGYSRATW